MQTGKPNWVNRSVAFNVNDPDELELLEYSKTLPNFTRMVKEWIRSIKYGGHPTQTWVPPRYDGFPFAFSMQSPMQSQMIEKEEAIEEFEMVEDFDEGQFL